MCTAHMQTCEDSKKKKKSTAKFKSKTEANRKSLHAPEKKNNYKQKCNATHQLPPHHCVQLKVRQIRRTRERKPGPTNMNMAPSRPDPTQQTGHNRQMVKTDEDSQATIRRFPMFLRNLEW